MKFGLEVQVIENIVSVLEQHPKVDKAFVFGSRAKGNYRPDSDIDIAIKGYEITTDDIIAISVAIETKGVTHKFDLINYNSIKEQALKEHIDRVGIEFYSRWKKMTLRDASCDFLSGYAFKSSDYSNIGIPLIKIGNIQNRNVTIDTNGDFVLENIINEKVSKYILSNNDVLIAMTGQGSVGRVGKLKIKEDERALLNQRVGKFICNEIDLNIDYLYYVLTSDKYQDLLFNTGSGSGQPNLSPELILETEIPWVNYKEQTAIASILGSLDDKINLLHRQNKTLEQLAETLFRQWFVEEAEESWEEKTLGEITDIKAGGDKPKIYSEIKTEKCNIPIYSNGIDKEGLYGYTDTARINIECITISARGTIGFVCLRQEPFVPIVRLISIIPNENYLSSKFLYLWAKSQNISGTGTTQEQLTVPDFSRTTIILPPFEKMKEFTNYVNTLFIKIEFNKNQIRTLTQTRDTLLPKLMSGEVRVGIKKEKYDNTRRS